MNLGIDPTKIETGSQLLVHLTDRPLLKDICAELLPNGVNPMDVIELSGKSASGKTEFLLQVIVKCILPAQWKGIPLNGLNCSVALIDNDFHFDMLRLVMLMEAKLSKSNSSISFTEKNIFIKSCLEKLYIMKCANSFQFQVTLHSLENFFDSHVNVCVLIIDSISAFYWWDRMTHDDNLAGLHSQYSEIAGKLKQLLGNHKLCLFVTRQLLMSNKPTSEMEYDYLGRDWQKFITTYMNFKIVPSDEIGSSTVIVNVKDADRKLEKKLLIKDGGITFC